MGSQSLRELHKKAKRAIGDKDYQRAIALLEQLVEMRTTRTMKNQITEALAEMHFRLGNRLAFTQTGKALEHLTRAAALREDDALYAYHVGLMHHRQAKHAPAIEWYTKALERDPAFQRAAFALAVAHTDAGTDPKKTPVWDTLDEALRERLSGELSGPLAEAFAAAEAGDWQAARPAFERALTGKDTPPLAQALAHYYLGVIAARAEDLTSALEHWQQAASGGFEHPDLTHNLTLACTLLGEGHLTAGRYAEALDLARAGLALDASHTRLTDIEAHCHLVLGIEAAEKASWRAARDHWAAPRDAQGQWARRLAANIAIAHEKLEEWHQAAEAWREFARRRPRKEGSEGWLNDEQVARLWSRVADLYRRVGIFDEAVSTLQNALKYDPDRPTLNLALVRAYIEDERYEAAENQLDRFLKTHPDHAEGLALKAEFAESYGSYFSILIGQIHGLAEWERVLETGDETYAPLARQHLARLHQQAFAQRMAFSEFKQAFKHAEQALEYDPDDHRFRALYVRGLLHAGRGKKKVEEQIARIDLSDSEAAVVLINGYFREGRPKEGHATIERIDAEHRLPPEAFLDLAETAFELDEGERAEGHLAEAAKRASEADRPRIRLGMGYILLNHGYEERAVQAWKELADGPDEYGPAHVSLALFNLNNNNVDIARRHLRKAEKWAEAHNDAETLELIRQIRQELDHPYINLIDPFSDEFEDF